ncbi:N-formylglutamate deformylase (plasmid) [Skermanella mucosa]|uniref:N-formylglutamate deformylase n=1 Tax=Skermanella mucosa TaxID=1789672 RepID=UPI00192C0309|nr:N-formylglutamate deformylase [Skermanella mucosa]UEM25352.1 N-formylglutamate deformylase [Skermanella mucosa]
MEAADLPVVERGDAPLILSMPHVGLRIPGAVRDRLADRALELEDTDWWIDRLYDFGGELDATVVRATVSRYVIDVNRDPGGASLYPGQATTELCPTTTFDGIPLYRPGAAPSPEEIDRDRRPYHAAYHEGLSAEIRRLRQRHPRVVLYDCHSIRSVVPRLFDGELPVFNIGTNGGASCAPEAEEIVTRACAEAEGFSHVVNGRFRGGWITRHYGDPGDGVHAIQMELAQRAYLAAEAPPWTYDPVRAGRLRAVLKPMLHRLAAWAADAANGQKGSAP